MNSALNRKVYVMNLRIVVALVLYLMAGGPGVRVARAAGPVYWDWPTDRSFSELELSGTALDRAGYPVAGLNARALGATGPEVFWQAVSDGQGGFYAGSGHGGEIYQTSAKGESRLVARLDATEIFSLLVLSDGDLLAGSGPDGQVYRIDRQGQSRIVGTVAGGYVWAMVLDRGTGVVWLAAGSPGAVYRYEVDSGDFAVELNLPVENVMTVRLTADGGLLLATQGPGLVYRREPGQSPQLLFETPQDEVRAFISGPDDAVYLLALQTDDLTMSGLAGVSTPPETETSPSLLTVLGIPEAPEIAPAVLYRIGSDDVVAPIWTGKRELMTAVWSRRWGWLGGGESAAVGGRAVVSRLFPPSGSAPLASWAGGDVLDIMITDDSENDLVVCQAHPGAVSGLFERGDSPHQALSPPLDGGQRVHWGRLRWSGEGRCERLRWSVRVGNRSEPDETWTEWSKTWSQRDHELDLPPSRYLQWRVEFPPAAVDEDVLRVTEVSASAWQDNQPPVITSFQLEYLQDVHLGGLLNGMENVTQRFRSGLQAEFSRNTVADKWAGPVRGAMGRSVRIFTWQAADPNEDRVTYRLEYRQCGTEVWRPLAIQRPGVFETSEMLASWDTADVSDGVYDLRLTASDRRDNPGRLVGEATRLLGPLVVDNTPPLVHDFAARLTTGGFVVRCRVEDKASVVAGARLRLPDGTFERLDPVDRICDSLVEDFVAEVVWPRAGIPAGDRPWLVYLEARDLNGNIASVEGEVR